MKISRRTKDGWIKAENVNKSVCDQCGDKLWVAPSGEPYCDGKGIECQPKIDTTPFDTHHYLVLPTGAEADEITENVKTLTTILKENGFKPTQTAYRILMAQIESELKEDNINFWNKVAFNLPLN